MNGKARYSKLSIFDFRFSIFDVLLSLLLLAGVGYTIYRLAAGVSYRWNWGAIPQYLFRYDPEQGRWVANLLVQGLFTTIRLSVWSILLAAFLGTVIGMLRTSQSLFKRMLGRTYVELVRNMPPLVLVFIFYYFLGDQIMSALGIEAFIRSRPPEVRQVLSFFFAEPPFFTAFATAALTIGIYEGAYIAEIVRAGIQSIEKGQWEASCASGLNRRQQMRSVILPQAVRRILPPLAGQFISTIKDSAIVSVISIQELTFQGLELMAATYLTFEVWITITVLYFLLTFSLSMAVSRLEVYMGRSD